MMVRNDGAAARKKRLEKIAQAIHAALYNNKELGYIPLKKTVALQMLDTGLTKAKIIEYLSLLEVNGQFEMDVEKDQIRGPAPGV